MIHAIIAKKISKALENEALPQMCRSVALTKYSKKECASKEKALFKELLGLDNQQG